MLHFVVLCGRIVADSILKKCRFSEIGTAKEYKKTIIPVQIEPFDLFKDFPNWAYMLKQYQKTNLFKTNAEEISALANYIEQTFNEIK